MTSDAAKLLALLTIFCSFWAGAHACGAPGRFIGAVAALWFLAGFVEEVCREGTARRP